jgi:hypothetical protein
MDANRFDALSKSFATRLSRRSAMRRGGVGIAATLLAAAGLKTTVARQSTSDWYTVIRRYTLSGSADQVVQELNNGFLPLLRQADGFVSYSVVTSENNGLTTIAVFESQAQQESAAQSESDWVQQNLASLLPTPAEQIHGDTAVYGLNTDLICGEPSQPTATVAPTVAPTEAPCTGIGCECNAGVQDACDEGLVCCQSQMNGNPMPGGPGMCAAADACGDDATPTA